MLKAGEQDYQDIKRLFRGTQNPMHISEGL